MGTEEGEPRYCSWGASSLVDGLGFVLEGTMRATQVCERSEGWEMSKAAVVKEDFLEWVA